MKRKFFFLVTSKISEMHFFLQGWAKNIKRLLVSSVGFFTLFIS